MTVAEKIEQYFTGRPSSYVPGHTLERLLIAPRSSGFRARRTKHSNALRARGGCGCHQSPHGRTWNSRTVLRFYIYFRKIDDWSNVREYNRGWGASMVSSPTLASVLPSSDCTLLRTWPVNEQIIDILHKAVFAIVAGFFTVGGYETGVKRWTAIKYPRRGNNVGHGEVQEVEAFSICLPQGPHIYSPSETMKHVMNDVADSWELIAKNHNSGFFRISSYLQPYYCQIASGLLDLLCKAGQLADHKTAKMLVSVKS
jgi:hypothetical protein